MVDTVNTTVMHSSPRRYAVQLTNLSDGTGESAAVKVDKSGLENFNGVEPDRLVIEEISWAISGFSAVQLFWDHTTDDEAAKLAGSGYVDYRSLGGLVDPQSAGGTGDLLATTLGAAANATYDITINMRLKGDA